MPEKHYYEQLNYTGEYLIPYFKRFIPDFKGLKILEIGCAEAGFLAVMKSHGAIVSGIEISKERVDIALEKNPDLKIFVGDISSSSILETINESFDFIVMREVIEHIPEKGKTFENLDKLLKQGGFLFVSFPPKYSPFAGHQQIGWSFMKMIPYLHILPAKILNTMAVKLKERPGYIEEIKYNYFTGMGIHRFEMFIKALKYRVIQKDHFLFRPVYKGRFGLPQVKLPGIPLLREFCTFGYEILLKKD
jgi:SAM-dependent methyltransferase